MRQAPPPVQQSCQRVREQGASRDGSGHDFDGIGEVVWNDVEQILRDAPDHRGMAKELVGIQVGAAMKAVAVVEVSVHHQDR
jgi:hypothetical protein